MSTNDAENRPTARNVAFSETHLIVTLIDERALSVPLAWYPRLARASRKQLENFLLLDDGAGIHWPTLDEDLSIQGLLQGQH